MYSVTERQSPLRISITGMDGSGKSSAYRAFVASVPENLTVVRISRFSSVIHNGEEQIVDRQISQGLDNFHSWADSTKNRRVVSVANALSVLYAWRVQEKQLVKKYGPDLVLALRDPYIDPIVYAKFYSPDTLGAMTLEGREKVLKGLHGAPVSNSVVFLDVDPQVAVGRIDQRLKEEAQAKTQLERSKWVHLHENITDLTAIRLEYANALSYFQSRHGTEIIEIDTVRHSKSEVAKILRAALLQPFENQLNANPKSSRQALV